MKTCFSFSTIIYSPVLNAPRYSYLTVSSICHQQTATTSLTLLLMKLFLQGVSVASCRAEPCISHRLSLSISPSVCHTLPKWRKLGSQNLHRRITPGLRHWLCKTHPKILKGSSLARVLKESGIGKIGVFRPISRRISDTVQDSTKVAVDHQQEVAYALSISAKIHLGWPWTAKNENLNEDRHVLSAAKCSQMTLLSGNVRFLHIFPGVPWREASNHCGVVDNGTIFTVFTGYILGTFRDKANIMI